MECKICGNEVLVVHDWKKYPEKKPLYCECQKCHQIVTSKACAENIIYAHFIKDDVDELPKLTDNKKAKELEKILTYISSIGGSITVDEIWDKMRDAKIFRNTEIKSAKEWIKEQVKHMRIDWN
jgi:hypothetical protein